MRQGKWKERCIAAWASYTEYYHDKKIYQLGHKTQSTIYIGDKPKRPEQEKAIKQALRHNNAQWCRGTATRPRPKPHLIMFRPATVTEKKLDELYRSLPWNLKKVIEFKYFPPEELGLKEDQDKAAVLGMSKQSFSNILTRIYKKTAKILNEPIA